MYLMDVIPEKIGGEIRIGFKTDLGGQAGLLAGDAFVEIGPLSQEGVSEELLTSHYVIGFCLHAGKWIESTGALPLKVQTFLDRPGYFLSKYKNRLDPALGIELDSITQKPLPVPFRLLKMNSNTKADLEVGGMYSVVKKPRFSTSYIMTKRGFGFFDQRVTMAALMSILCHFIYLRTFVLKTEKQRIYLDTAAGWVGGMQDVPSMRNHGFNRWWMAAVEGYKSAYA